MCRGAGNGAVTSPPIRLALCNGLVHCGRENAEIAVTVEAFVASTAASGANPEVIDVPHGQHGFDMLDHTEDFRQAVAHAMTWVAAGLHTH